MITRERDELLAAQREWVEENAAEENVVWAEEVTDKVIRSRIGEHGHLYTYRDMEGVIQHSYEGGNQ